MDLRSASCFVVLVTGLLLVSANASSKKVYIVYMGEKKHDDPSLVTASHHDLLSTVIGSKEEAINSIVYSYKHAFSGFAAMLTKSQAKAIASLPGVASVRLNAYHQLTTTRSWDFLGVDYYQPKTSSRLLQKAKYGEDIIVGVIDSGIWPESPSFDDTGYGPVPARWKGACQSGDKFDATNCNRKIIGARWYAKDVPDPALLKDEYMSARDKGGHGTHTASTIAGSPVRNASFGGLAAGTARGGAPRARVAVYKACWGAAGQCGDAGIVAAIDDAVHDGVDVLSLSLTLAFEGDETLHAVAREITVVFSGGNDGPAAHTLKNAMPWVLTVAASTIDRSFPTIITLGNNDEKLVGQSLYFNTTLDSGGFHELVYAGSCNEKALENANATGNVVLCYDPSQPDSASLPPQGFRAVFPGVAAAKPKGLIFAQHNSDVPGILDNCRRVGLPCVLVDFEIAYTMITYAAGAAGQSPGQAPVVRISPAATVTGSGVLSPKIAAFSSRGPSPLHPGLIKPDIAAPGVGILAAVGDEYKLMSGTSMACPHVSAVVALLKSVHPDWSPAMIKSAIITTASVTDRFGMPIQAHATPQKLADPFDMGGGHLNPDRAADPGLVYDEDPATFTKWSNGEALTRELNLPSIAVPDLKGAAVTVSRTVTNVGPAEATYWAMVQAPAGVSVSVEPQLIKFGGGGSRKATFRVTFKAKQWVQGVYTFGSLTWLGGNNHSVRSPLAVRIIIQDFVSDTS